MRRARVKGRVKVKVKVKVKDRRVAKHEPAAVAQTIGQKVSRVAAAWHARGVPPTKAELRNELRVRRQTIAPEELATRSASLVAAIADDARWQDAVSVAAFVGVGGEPDTMPLLRAALQAGKALWLPRVLDARGGQTELVRVRDLDTLVEGGFGLREPSPDDGPREPRLVPSMELDVVLVPGLAFGRDGVRLGHGPGHYDRLLAPVRDLDRPWRVGVCLRECLDPIPEALPAEDHDVPMHLVATEEGIFECSARTEVPHVIEPAASGRAKCRGCGRTIDKGTLRFGEKVDNPYGEGYATWWFHLVCGAMRRPEAFDALMRHAEDLHLDAGERLWGLAKAGIEYPRLARITKAERDKSGRARCRQCRDTIDKQTWRIALGIWEDGRFSGMGFLHVACATAYFGTDDAADLRARIEAMSPGLEAGDLDQLQAQLSPAALAPPTP